ncbi:MAG: HipA N-terminal domain-containing protein [Bacteroidota bacterium]
MRQADIFYKDEYAGVLTEHDDGSYSFRYTDAWILDSKKPSISLTLPKSQQTHTAPYLLPFFYHMLSEGTNKAKVCQHLRIDPEDEFGLLLRTAHTDTIGAVTIKKRSAS